MIEDRKAVLNSIKETEDTINGLVAGGFATDQLPQLWRTHFVRNGYSLEGGEIVDSHRKDWFPGLSEEHRQALINIADKVIEEKGLKGDIAKVEQWLAQKDTKIQEEEDLGPAIYSLTFGGPYKHSLIFSKSAGEPVTERNFMLHHMTNHLMNPTHLPSGLFSIGIEFKRDHIPPGFTGDLYQRIEKEADDAAAMTLFSEYAENTYFSSVPPEARRGGKSIEPPTLRQLLLLKYDADRTKMGFIARAFAKKPEERVSGKPLPYTDSLKVIRTDDQEERFTYLAGQDEQGNLWRRWIPGNVVLSHIGLQAEDIATVSRDSLTQHQDLEPLINPREVSIVRQLLVKSILNQQDSRVQPNFL